MPPSEAAFSQSEDAAHGAGQRAAGARGGRNSGYIFASWRRHSATSVFDGARMSCSGEGRQRLLAARSSAGPCGWAAAVRPDTISTDSGAAGVARPRAPRVEIPATSGLGVVRSAPPYGRNGGTGAPGIGRLAARRGRQAAAATTARRGAQPPRPRAGAAGAHAAERPKNKDAPPEAGRLSCAYEAYEGICAARTLVLYTNFCLSSRWIRQKIES